MKKADKHSSSIIDEIMGSITAEESHKIETKMEIAVIIDEAIKAKGWKKKDFAEALNITNLSVISRWLSGTHNFTIDTLCDIESVLDIKLLNINTKPQMPSISVNLKISKDNKSLQINSNHTPADYCRYDIPEGKSVNKFQYLS